MIPWFWMTLKTHNEFAFMDELFENAIGNTSDERWIKEQFQNKKFGIFLIIVFFYDARILLLLLLIFVEKLKQVVAFERRQFHWSDDKHGISHP